MYTVLCIQDYGSELLHFVQVQKIDQYLELLSHTLESIMILLLT